MLDKKGQTMVFMSVLAVFVFLLAFTLFFDYLMVSPRVSTDEYQFIQQENSRLADALLLPGVPLGWNEDTVLRIGLVDNNVLNTTKAGYFQSISQENNNGETGYERGKTLLGLFYEYLIIIEDQNGDNLYSIGDYQYSDEGRLTEEHITNLKPATITIQERTVLRRENNRFEPTKIKVYTYRR